MGINSFIEKLKLRFKERIKWFYTKPERSFLLKIEITLEEFREILSNNVDESFKLNPLAPISRYKKKYKGEVGEREFRVKKKYSSFSPKYSFSRITGKLVSKLKVLTLDVEVQSFMGKWREVYILFFLLFQFMYFIAVYYGKDNYDFGFHLILIFALIYIGAMINYGENYKVHFLEEEFIEDLKSWFE